MLFATTAHQVHRQRAVGQRFEFQCNAHPVGRRTAKVGVQTQHRGALFDFFWGSIRLQCPVQRATVTLHLIGGKADGTGGNAKQKHAANGGHAATKAVGKQASASAANGPAQKVRGHRRREGAVRDAPLLDDGREGKANQLAIQTVGRIGHDGHENNDFLRAGERALLRQGPARYRRWAPLQCVWGGATMEFCPRVFVFLVRFSPGCALAARCHGIRQNRCGGHPRACNSRAG